MNHEKTLTEQFAINIPRPVYEPSPPSPFEMGVVDQLKGLAAEIESGDLHIQHFSLTVKDDHQRLEIEVE